MSRVTWYVWIAEEGQPVDKPLAAFKDIPNDDAIAINTAVDELKEGSDPRLDNGFLVPGTSNVVLWFKNARTAYRLDNMPPERVFKPWPKGLLK